MRINGSKELTTVLYGESAVKILHTMVIDSRKICFSKHWHERMELILVTEGSVEFTVGDDCVTLNAGHLGIAPPEKPHAGESGSNGAEYYTVMFDVANFYNASFAAAKYLKPITAIKTDFLPFTDDAETVSLIKSLIEEYESGDEYSALGIVGRIYILINLLYRKCLAQPFVNEKESSCFSHIEAFIDECFCENISTADLSSRFGYSEEYFCRLFKKNTGLTPVSYINILRLEKAKQLLQDKKRKVSEIASECGFQSTSYFSKLYKKHFGFSPCDERKSM